MTVDDVAYVLKIPRSTIYELVKQNEIPHRKLGRRILFHKQSLMQWYQAREMT